MYGDVVPSDSEKKSSYKIVNTLLSVNTLLFIFFVAN